MYLCYNIKKVEKEIRRECRIVQEEIAVKKWTCQMQMILQFLKEEVENYLRNKI